MRPVRAHEAPWDHERRARELVARREELLARLPVEMRAARPLTPDLRELIVDDAIEFAALRHEQPLSTSRDLERVFWDAVVKRIRRAHDGRYDIVRAGYARVEETELELLAGDSDPVAAAERRAEHELVREFAATLEPREQRVLDCKYDPSEPEPLGYKAVAQRLRLRIGVVRSAERAIGRKMDRFAAVYAAGRVCDARAADLDALAAGSADRRQARAALAHVATCGHCRPLYAALLRALRSAAFGRKLAALLPLPVTETQDRQRLRGAWDALTDTVTRPFAHDGGSAATQLATGGAGRGAGTAIALKVAAAVCIAGAGTGACLQTGLLTRRDAHPDKPAARHSQRPRPTATPANDARPASATVTAPRATATPRPKRAHRQRASQQQRATQGATGPTSHEQAPASPAPPDAAPNGASEFDPTYQPSQPAQPAPAPAAPGSDEFF